MDEVISLYQANKLIVRAMDTPRLTKVDNDLMYDCSTWANEFTLMQLNKFSSVSSTLIIPNVGIPLYKNVGFLVNANTADCFHISKNDSGSCGNMLEGDFQANNADFTKIEDLIAYILKTKSKDMNEVNLNLKLDDVVGLVVVKCLRENKLIEYMLIVQDCLRELTNIEYPLYQYDFQLGIMSKLEINQDLINEYDYFYYTDNSNDICFKTTNKPKTL